MTELTYEEIHNKEDAVRLGKNRGWCTADNTRYYDTDYSSNFGRLFVIFKQPKIHPQYQIFFSKFGGVELRAKFNKYIDHEIFFLNEAKSLFNWYESLKQMPTARKNNAQTIGRALRAEQDRYRINYNDFQPTIARSIVENLTNDEIERSNYSHDQIIRIKLKIKESEIVRVHRKIEMPNIYSTRVGQVFHIAEDNIVLLRTEYRSRQIYLISSNTEYVSDVQSYDIINRVAEVSYESRKLELNFHLNHNYFSTFSVLSDIKRVYRTGQFEETVECTMVEPVRSEVYFNRNMIDEY